MSEQPKDTTGNEQAHKMFLAKYPPQVRFTKEIRDAVGADQEQHLNYLEFMTAVMELHPMVHLSCVLLGQICWMLEDLSPITS